jgi:hypothetical protein
MITKKHTFKLFFSKSYRKKQKMAGDIDAYLCAIPPCSKVVLVASPTYDKHEYNCTITVPASELLSWSLKYVDEPIIMAWRDEVVRQSLPLWFSQASHEDTKQLTKLPVGAFKAIKHEIAQWVAIGAADVWCYSCKQLVTDIRMAREDESNSGRSYASWTDIWRCPAGHTLYAATNEMRITFISRSFD